VGAEEKTPRAWKIDLAYMVGGMLMLVLGSRWLVDGAVRVAVDLGVSELVIGLTIIASAPPCRKWRPRWWPACAANATSPWATWSAATSSTSSP